MTSLESIERLRERGKVRFEEESQDPRMMVVALHPFELTELADEIEREIAEKYMELPVDVDCVPIHVGDMLLKSTGAPKASYGEVVGVSDDSIFFKARQGWESNWASLTRHVKPRTVEDVLVDFYGEFAKAKYGEDSEVLSHYADEIRELMGGGR